MSSGLPDWSNTLQTQELHDNFDIAELAVRLSSPVRHFRTGQVIRFTSFDDSDNTPLIVDVGAGSSHVKSTDRVMSGKNSLKCIVGANASDGVQVTFFDRVKPKNNIGLSWVMFSREDEGEFLVTLTYGNGVDTKQASVDYRINTHDLTLTDENLNGIEFANEILPEENNYWYPSICKIIIDVINWKYLYFITNSSIYDISAYGMYDVTTFPENVLTVQIQAINYTVGTHTTYIDDIVLTIDEPV